MLPRSEPLPTVIDGGDDLGSFRASSFYRCVGDGRFLRKKVLTGFAVAF